MAKVAALTDHDSLQYRVELSRTTLDVALPSQIVFGIATEELHRLLDEMDGTTNQSTLAMLAQIALELSSIARGGYGVVATLALWAALNGMTGLVSNLGCQGCQKGDLLNTLVAIADGLSEGLVTSQTKSLTSAHSLVDARMWSSSLPDVSSVAAYASGDVAASSLPAEPAILKVLLVDGQIVPARGTPAHGGSVLISTGSSPANTFRRLVLSDSASPTVSSNIHFAHPGEIATSDIPHCQIYDEAIDAWANSCEKLEGSNDDKTLCRCSEWGLFRVTSESAKHTFTVHDAEAYEGGDMVFTITLEKVVPEFEVNISIRHWGAHDGPGAAAVMGQDFVQPQLTVMIGAQLETELVVKTLTNDQIKKDATFQIICDAGFRVLRAEATGTIKKSTNSPNSPSISPTAPPSESPSERSPSETPTEAPTPKRMTCDGHCGTVNNDADCECDPNCLSYDDCCDDYVAYCDTFESCVGNCGVGGNKDRSCHCDDQCQAYGDCCDDYESECNSCAGACGSKAPFGTCYCDFACFEHDDCCPDAMQECGGTCETGCGYIDGAECHCDAQCVDYGDCCHDHADVCLSCTKRCGNFDEAQSCQCDSLCGDAGDCCANFKEACN
jgi:hypothetical protein